MLSAKFFHTSFLTIRAVLLWSFVVCLETAAQADEEESRNRPLRPLTITYFEYPPNIVESEGQPRGLFVTKLTQIADKAGLSIVWQRSTVETEVQMLDEGKEGFCTSGKLYSEDRARQWIYVPYVFASASANIVIAHPDVAKRVAAHDTVVDLIRNHNLTGTLLLGATYGDRVDRFLRADRPLWVLREGHSDHQLLSMVSAEGADYAIVQERQWQMAQAKDPILTQLIEVPSLREKVNRPIYLACSRTLNTSVFQSLADAMASLGFPYQALYSPSEISD